MLYLQLFSDIFQTILQVFLERPCKNIKNDSEISYNNQKKENEFALATVVRYAADIDL